MKGMLSSSWFTTAHLVTAKQHKQILEGPESLSQNPFCVSNFEEKWKKTPHPVSELPIIQEQYMVHCLTYHSEKEIHLQAVNY